MNLLNKNLLIGILSYLYLFFCLHNYYYDIIFLYFIILFIGFFIVKNKIFIIASFLLIFHFIFINISREGIQNKPKPKSKKQSEREWDTAVKNSEKREKKGPEAPIDDDEKEKMKKIGDKKDKNIVKQLDSESPLYH